MSPYESNLIANVNEIGGEAKLGHGAEGDEEEKIWVVSRLEGSHLRGERDEVLSDGLGTKSL